MSLRTVANFPQHLRGPQLVPDEMRWETDWSLPRFSGGYPQQRMVVLTWKSINPFRELVVANVRVMLKRRLARNGVPFHVDMPTETLRELNKLVRIQPLPLPG